MLLVVNASGPVGENKRPEKVRDMRNDDQGVEQVTARQRKKRPRSCTVELTEQQDGGNQIVDRQGRFVGTA